MNHEWTRDEIVNVIKKDLLLEGLDLANAGVTLQDIKDDTPLLNEGLAIDSVAALDLLVAVEKTFGLKLPDLGRSFIEAKCKNVQHLADFVVASLRKSKSVETS
jgi:acyl carrier protein